MHIPRADRLRMTIVSVTDVTLVHVFTAPLASMAGAADQTLQPSGSSLADGSAFPLSTHLSNIGVARVVVTAMMTRAEKR